MKIQRFRRTLSKKVSHMNKVFSQRIALRIAIVGAGILIYWISGGFPPAVLVALFQMITYAAASDALNQLNLQSPIVILIVQVWLLVFAWGILLWLAVGEILSIVFPLSELEARRVVAVETENNYSNGTGRKLRGSASTSSPGSARSTLPNNFPTRPIPRSELSGDIELLPPRYKSRHQDEEEEDREDEPSLPSLKSFYQDDDEDAWEDQPVRLPAFQKPPVRTSGAKEEQITHEAPRVHAQSHTGLIRADRPNEDSYWHTFVLRQLPQGQTQWSGLFLVADGMGGHNQGQYASSRAIEIIRTSFEPALRDPEKSIADLKELFVVSVQLANTLLCQENQKAGVFRGTTVTGAILFEDLERSGDQQTREKASSSSLVDLELEEMFPGLSGKEPPSSTYTAHIINVGDSRAYHYAGPTGFYRITRDHTTVENLIEQGVISPEERYTSQRRNEIYRCLGNMPEVEVDVFTAALQPGDRFLLCTDGLWEMVRDPDLAAFLCASTEDPARITKQLLQAALAQGGRDNLTALVIIIPGRANVRAEQARQRVTGAQSKVFPRESSKRIERKKER